MYNTNSDIEALFSDEHVYINDLVFGPSKTSASRVFMGEFNIEQIKALGKRFEAVMKGLADFRILTNKSYLSKHLDELEQIKKTLDELGAASILKDGSLIIRTELLLPFLNPDATNFNFSNRSIDLSDPEIVEKVALNCGLNQWLFFAKRLPTEEEQKKFLQACVKAVAKDKLKKKSGGSDQEDQDFNS